MSEQAEDERISWRRSHPVCAQTLRHVYVKEVLC